MSDTHHSSSLPLTFGRILVRIVLSEPRLDNVAALPRFQRVYAPEESLHNVAWDAWAHFAPHLPGGPYDPLLCFHDQGVSTVDWAAVTLGDWLNMRADDQTTLGTVQFELRCVASDVEARR